MKKVSLSELIPSIRDCFILVKEPFLKKVLFSVSKEKKAYRDQQFVETAGYRFNHRTGCSPGLYAVFKGEKSIRAKNLEKILKLSEYEWGDVEKNLVYLKAGRRRGWIKPTFPMSVDERLGSIIGHILGDGSIDRKYSQVFFSNTNKDLLYDFQQNMLMVFGVQPRVWVQKKRKFEEKSKWILRVSDIGKAPKNHPVGLFYPSICGKVLMTIFGEFAKGKHKEITQEILEADIGFKKKLIKAFFDDEGNVFAPSYTLRFYQDDKQLLSKLQMLLREVNITSNPIRHYFKREKRRHYFSITKKENHKRFFENISCNSQKKRAQLSFLALK